VAKVGGDGGLACGGAAKVAAAADGGVSLVHASSWAKTGVDVPASLLAMSPPQPTPLVHATPVSMSMII
jgi:hypothetical protein